MTICPNLSAKDIISIFFPLKVYVSSFANESSIQFNSFPSETKLIFSLNLQIISLLLTNKLLILTLLVVVIFCIPVLTNILTFFPLTSFNPIITSPKYLYWEITDLGFTISIISKLSSVSSLNEREQVIPSSIGVDNLHSTSTPFSLNSISSFILHIIGILSFIYKPFISVFLV